MVLWIISIHHATFCPQHGVVDHFTPSRYLLPPTWRTNHGVVDHLTPSRYLLPPTWSNKSWCCGSFQSITLPFAPSMELWIISLYHATFCPQHGVVDHFTPSRYLLPPTWRTNHGVVDHLTPSRYLLPPTWSNESWCCGSFQSITLPFAPNME